MLDRNSAIPLYLQVEEWALENIRLGVWKENEKLLPEADIAHALGVNRITLRQGFDLLIKRGYLERIHGRGVFVRKPGGATVYDWKLDTIMTGCHNPSFQDISLETKVIDFSSVKSENCPLKIFDAHVNVFSVMRLRSIGLTPACIERSWIAHKFLQNTTEQDLENSKYACVRKNGYIISHIDRSVTPLFPSPEDKKLLKLSTQDVCLQVNGTTYLNTGEILEYSESIYNAGIFNFTLTVYS